MKPTTFEVKSEHLRDTLRIISHVEYNAAIESSQFVKVSTKTGILRMSLAGAAAGSGTVTAKGVPDFTVFLDRKALSAYLENAEDGALTVNVNTGTVELQNKKHKLKLTSHSALGGYAGWDKSKGTPLNVPDNYLEELPWLAEYVAYGPPLEHLTSVHAVKGYGAIGTDSIALAARLDAELKADFCVTPLIAKLLKSKVKVLAAPDGVGAVFNNGYVYQPFSISKKEYPLKAFQTLITECLKITALIRVETKKLLEAIQYLNKFGKPEFLNWKTTASGVLLLKNDLLAGHASTELKVNCSKEAKGQWALGKLIHYLNHLVALDDSCTVWYNSTDSAHMFRSGVKSSSYVLILVKNN